MALEKYHTKLDSDSNLWHAKPKVHLLGHILDKVAGEGMNPKDTWNYKDETFGSKIPVSYTHLTLPTKLEV